MQTVASSSINKLLLRTRSRIDKVQPLIRAAERESARAMVERGRSLSRGTLTRRDLQRLGNPYGIGRTSPQDDAIVNVGPNRRFERAWMYRLGVNADGIQITVFNADPAAQFLLGTRKMRHRTIIERIAKLEQPLRLARLKAAQREILRG